MLGRVPDWRWLARWNEPQRSSWLPAGAGTLGAAYLLLLTAWVSRGPLVDPSTPVLGTAAGAVANLVVTRYADEVARIYITVVAGTIIAGATLGTVTGLLLALGDRIQGRRTVGRATGLVRLLVLVVLGHALLLAHSMAVHPFAYAASFYERGGARRAIELFVTEQLTPGLVLGLGALLVALVLVGGVFSWRRSFTSILLWARAKARALMVVVGVGLLAALATQVSPGRATTSTRENVLILASDSLRFDRLRPDLMPNLSAVAARGTLFQRAYVTVPRTFPSWTTILTGRHAHHHGVRSTFDPWQTRAHHFDALPDRFAAAGYRTSVVSDFAGDIFARIPLGFQHVDVPRNDFRQWLQEWAYRHTFPLLPFLDNALGRLAFPAVKTGPLVGASEVRDSAIRQLRSAGDTPFFLTVFFSTTHFPYAAPYPYYRKYANPAYRGTFKYGRSANVGQVAPSEDDVGQIRALYEGAVASVDDAAGAILAELRRTGKDRNTIIVVLADHGESLYEPGMGFGHGEHLFGDFATHIPLVISDPRQAPHVEAALVSTVDLAPTLYDLAGIAPPSDLDGRSLAPGVRGEKLASTPVFAETELLISDDMIPEPLRLPTPPMAKLLTVDEAHFDQIVVRPEILDLELVARHRMVRDERWKLVYMPTRTGVHYLLFDTESDPAERNDVFAKEPEQAARLQKILWDWMLEDPLMTESHGYLLPKRVAQ